MNKKSNILFKSSIMLLTTFLITLLYLYSFKTIDNHATDKKNHFVTLTALPGLALSDEHIASRYRSLSGVGEIYTDDPSLREYFKSSYTYTFLSKERK